MFEKNKQNDNNSTLAAPVSNPKNSEPKNETALPVIEMIYGGYEFHYITKKDAPALFWREHKEKEHIDHFISAMVEVVAQMRDIDNTGYGRQIRYIDQDGNERTFTLRFANISRDCDAIISTLRDRGLFITSSSHARKLVDFIHNVKVDRKIRTTDLAGWHEENTFVLPGRTIGNPVEEIVFSNDNLKLKPILSHGSLVDWQQNVSRYCVGNHVLAFTVSISLAAPLLNIIHQENGGFNLMGDSSIGKSTALAVSTSVFGNPKDAIQKWNMTINSLEGVAKAYNDNMLPLDEIGQSTANQIGEIVYMLGNGSGKGRANIHAEARKRVQFRTLFLSNGEKSLEEHMGEASKKVKAGQEVRLVDFPANCDCGYGIYQDIYGFESSRKFNDMLLLNAKTYHGSPFDAYIGHVIANMDTLTTFLRESIESFIEKNVPDNASSQVMRIATRFALVAAAGTFASQHGITGWPEDEALRAVEFCFNKWLKQRGNVTQSEEFRVISQVEKFFEANGESRFTKIHTRGNENTLVRDRVGFSEESGGIVRYFVLPNQLDQIIAGFNKTSAIKILVKEGYIVPDKHGKPLTNKRLPGAVNSKKIYEFSNKVLAEAVENETDTDMTISEGNNGNNVTE
jgi:putative DNA primase/helicase